MVVVLLILLINLIVYYEIRLNRVVSKYNKEKEIFGGLTANSVLEELNKSSNLKENVQQYREYLESRFDELNTMNKNLKDQVKQLKSEVSLLKSQLDYQKAKEIGPTEQFRLFQHKNDELQKLNDQIKELCLELKNLNATGTGCD